MKQFFLRHLEGNTSLLLFFAGWGAEPCMFGYNGTADNGSCDILMCYDYRDMQFDTSVLEGYSGIAVLGWSMGVWVAGHTLTQMESVNCPRIAVNGTPFPIHDTMGIPEAIFDGTLATLSDRTLTKFRRRMCGSSAAMEQLTGTSLSRPTDELRDELAAIGQAVRQSAHDSFRWTKAIVGLDDLIFPPDNQQAAWKAAGVPATTLNIPHWDHVLFRKLLYEDGTWTNN